MAAGNDFSMPGLDFRPPKQVSCNQMLTFAVVMCFIL